MAINYGYNFYNNITQKVEAFPGHYPSDSTKLSRGAP